MQDLMGSSDIQTKLLFEKAGQVIKVLVAGDYSVPPVMLVIRNILFALLGPGMVTVFGPWLVLRHGWPGGFPWWSWPGVLPLAVGLAVLFWCIRDFARKGRGTLAPVDPPKELVASGLYRHVRNPMYLGVFSMLLGEAWLFVSWSMVVYALVFLAVTHCFVIFYEEPTLRRMFGESYVRYRLTVNRWWPRMNAS